MENRNQNLLLVSAALVISLFVAVFFVFNYREKKDAKAQAAMYRAIYHFEAGDYTKALNGEEATTGLLEVIKTYSGTKTAHLARFYAGVCYMKQAQYEKAIEQLGQCKIDDWLLQARAYCLLGDAHSQKKAYKEAASYYEKAASYKENPAFSPVYLTKAAFAYEESQQLDKAIQCFEKTISKFPKSEYRSIAKKHLSRLKAILQGQHKK